MATGQARGRGVRQGLLARFALLAAAVAGALVAGLWLGASRGGAEGFVQAGIVAGFLALGAVIAAWVWADAQIARPAEALAGALRAHAQGAAGAVPPAPALGDLAAAATATATALADTRGALSAAVARETARIGAEKARLEALLSGVGEGVVLCSGAHRLAFYNAVAGDMLGAAPGLDRPLFALIHDGPVRHAHERLIAAGDTDAVSDLLCTTVADARALAARMRLLPPEGAGPPGYVLTFRDVTAERTAEAARRMAMDRAVDRLRRPAAGIAAILGVVPPGEALPPRLDGALRDEAAALALAVTALAQGLDQAEAGPGQALTRASDLVEGVAARLEAAGLPAETAAEPLLLRCDGFEVMALCGHLARELAAAGIAQGFRVALVADGGGALLRLGWQGPPLAVGLLEGWLDAPLDESLPGLTGRAVLAAHATEVWPEAEAGGHALCLPLAALRREGPRPAPVARAVVYDFDLLSRERGARVADTALSDLTAVVFDTEATGLSPDEGDEIVQIAALRIVNGRRVAGEVFDTLVNPGRPIPARSTGVHGITDAMVEGAPAIAEAGRAFHRFAEGAVLVAHNAPFDMAFFRRHEAAIGARFDHPVLDTVLLSAVVFGQSEVHTLDALCHRLGISIPEEARHTALGDARATAEAFLRLVPMLEARGLATFDQVLTEVRRHGRLLKDLN